jgi:hypothetical protein
MHIPGPVDTPAVHGTRPMGTLTFGLTTGVSHVLEPCCHYAAMGYGRCTAPLIPLRAICLAGGGVHA